MCHSQSDDILLPDNKYCSEVLDDSISKNGFYIPSNINECNKELDKILGKQPKQLLRDARDIELKRVLGISVFSEWTERESSRLCCYFRTKGIDSYEDRDYLILLSYKKHLLNLDFDIDTECNKIRLYHDSISKERKIRYENNIRADSIDGFYIPENLDDCLPALDRLLNDTVKFMIKNADSTTDFHFGLGRWLRNNWGLWGGSRLQLWFINQGIEHPDDISGLILSVYQEYLQKESVDTRQKLVQLKAEYEQFAKEMREMQENHNNFEPVEFNEEDYYSDEYKDFLKCKHIEWIYISR
jgi:hypothetical protein